jgi:hypothetical protein
LPPIFSPDRKCNSTDCPAALKDASDSLIRLHAGFILRERAGDQQTAGRFISHWQAQRLPYNFA